MPVGMPLVGKGVDCSSASTVPLANDAWLMTTALVLASAVISTASVSLSVSVVFANGVTEDGVKVTLLLPKVVNGTSVVWVVFAFGGRRVAIVALLVLFLWCVSNGSYQAGRYTPGSSDRDKAGDRLKRDGLGHDDDDSRDLLLLLGLGCLDLPIWNLLDTVLTTGDDLSIRKLLHGLAATGVELAIVQLDDGTLLKMRRASGRESGHKGGIRCNLGEMHVAFPDGGSYAKGRRLRARGRIGSGKMVMCPYLGYCHLGQKISEVPKSQHYPFQQHNGNVAMVRLENLDA